MSAQLTISNVVAQKGFAFAVTADRASVFVPPNVFSALEAPAKGARISVEVKSGAKGLIASLPQSAAGSSAAPSWAAWQVGADQLRLPNTQAGSEHTVSFGCFRCGQPVLTPDNIYKIKDGSVWTKTEPDSIQRGAEFHNEFKATTANKAQCGHCNFCLGAVYPTPFKDDEDPLRTFPCAKLTHVRESRRDDSLMNSLVLLAPSRSAAETALGELVRHELASKTGGLRMGRLEHDLAAQLEALQLSADDQQR